MNIIFLDCDGVINNSVTFENSHKELIKNGIRDIAPIEEESIKALSEICKRGDAKIVLSSTWRMGWNIRTGEKTLYITALFDLCNKYDIDIIDKTDTLGDNRGEQIQRWLNKNKEMVDNFLIIDDEICDIITFNRNKILKTEFFGKCLGIEHVEEAIRILKG